MTELATELHDFCIKNYVFMSSITSWMEFQEIRDRIGGKWNDFSQDKMLRIMKRGVELHFFSEPHWSGVGLTPWADSARRARMWDVIKEMKK